MFVQGWWPAGANIKRQNPTAALQISELLLMRMMMLLFNAATLFVILVFKCTNKKNQEDVW